MARRFGIGGKISTYPSMVLGTSDVRLIDMTRAFASVANRGVSVMPYAIRKVQTHDGRLLYQHDRSEGRVLVAPWVAAGMTDLMQSAVLSGTGRAANIGRPVAGKTGTTSSNKDGWFVGFSSGITTGVWMGRDDAKAVPGLQGGTAPARAFSAFMRYATKNRPVEEFDTEVQLPEWQLEPDDEFYYGDPGDEYYYIDEEGNLIEPGGPDERRGVQFPEGDEDSPVEPVRRPDPRAPAPAPTRTEAPQAASDDFLNRATGRQQAPSQGTAPPRQPQ